MGKFIDLTGKKCGRLTVLYLTGEKRGKERVWHCRCDCGNECDVVGKNLRGGQTKSCGCLKKESDRRPKGNVIDMVGKKFGHLTVLERRGSDKHGQALWLCECDCEKKTQLVVLGGNLRRGHTMSCGCERRSHGELKIEELLSNNGILFEQEYKAFKFSSGMWAKYDFYVNKNYMIEYDGVTHYHINNHGWKSKDAVNSQQERDVIKNQWCKDNDIPLIRIPYWRYNDLCLDDLKLETTEFLVN